MSMAISAALVLDMVQAGCPQRPTRQVRDHIHFICGIFLSSLYSLEAAEAGQCANEQGKFWEFHDVIYKSDDLLRRVI